MADLVNIITWPEVDVTPLDDALVYETAIGNGGVIYGIDVTLKTSNTLHVSAGHAVICGRKLTVVEGDVSIPLSTSGDLNGRIYLQLDLSNATTPASIQTEVAAQLTPPIQDENVNITNGTYEIDLYHFTVSPVTIGGLQKVFSPVESAETVVNGLNNIVFRTLTVAGWQLSGDVYTQTISFTKIHSLMPYVVPCGNAIGTLPTDEHKSAFDSLQCIGDTTANTMTFYASEAPAVAINIVIQGVV